MNTDDKRHLLSFARLQFKLNMDGYHGIRHWERVESVGLELARVNKINPDIITAFAYIHDCCRQNEEHDPEHGLRSALAWAHYTEYAPIGLSLHQKNLVYQAIRDHNLGLTVAPIEVQTCWDADRLDLPRVGCQVDTNKLCTKAGIAYHTNRSSQDHHPKVWAPQYGMRWIGDQNHVRSLSHG